MAYFIEFLFRWLHVVFGVAWVGLLYYFNFVQGEYFKEAEADAKADVLKKLAPRALWWFRWAAMFTFFTGLYLFASLGTGVNQYIGIGALMGTLMFLNVWFVIWPNQRIVCGMVEGDGAAAGAKALLASRTNVLFSAPMLFGMLGSKHGTFGLDTGGLTGISLLDPGFLIALLVVAAIEFNGIKGTVRPIASIVGVIHLSLLLTAVIFLAIHYL